MRTGELRGREDFEAILVETLRRGWSLQYGSEFRVSLPSRRGEQIWFEQPLLSALYTRRVERRVRRYLADSFRYTTVTWRAPAQWVLGTLLSTAPALRLRASPALSVSPDVANSESLLVIPGNQRVRIVDFDRGLCRVMLKDGFDSRAIASEAAVRGPGHTGPFVSLTTVDLANGWFEEPLIVGFNLARCPPWRDRAGLMCQAFDKLVAWARPSYESVDAAAYAAGLVTRIEEQLEQLEERFGPGVGRGVRERLVGLQAVAGRLGQTQTARSHGDFQAANVMVHTPSQQSVQQRSHGPGSSAASVGSGQTQVLISDWEYSGRRFYAYDLLRWGLGAGNPPGLAQRIRRFTEEAKVKEVGLHLPQLADPDWRAGAVALFLIEDQIRALDESLSGRYHTPVLWSSLVEELRELDSLTS